MRENIEIGAIARRKSLFLVGNRLSEELKLRKKPSNLEDYMPQKKMRRAPKFRLNRTSNPKNALFCAAEFHDTQKPSLFGGAQNRLFFEIFAHFLACSLAPGGGHRGRGA